jgi:hypothetical protein
MTAPCSRCATPLEAGDLRCAICAQPAPSGGTPPPETVARILRCESCGAAVAFSAEHKGTRCAFCGSVTHLEEPHDPIEAAEAFLPFATTPDSAVDAVRGWLGTLGFFRPSDLAKRATVENVKPLYFAGWIFDADALISWAADSNEGARRSAWAPHSGQTRMRFDSVLVSASRGLTTEEVSRLAPAFDLRKTTSAPSGPEDATIERFDVQRSAARAVIARAVESTAIDRVSRGEVPGSRVRNCHVGVVLHGLVSRRYALPVYVLAYRYDDKPYRAIVHGQDARIAFGDAPLSWRKIMLVVAGVLAVILTIVLFASRR